MSAETEYTDEDWTFEALYRGEGRPLRVALLGSSLKMGEPYVKDGVYELTADEFRSICKGIYEEKKGHGQYAFESPEAVAKEADENGLAERWFRLSEATYQWALGKEPISAFDITMV